MRVLTLITMAVAVGLTVPAAADPAATKAWVVANAKPLLSVANPGDLFNFPTLVNRDTQFTGVVGVVTRFNSGGGSSCTGSVIGSNTVLTAAHCLGDDGSGVRNVRVYLPDFNAPRAPSILASAYYSAPGYNGSIVHGSDVAIIKLSQNVPFGTAIYGLDHGTVASNLGVEQMVGLGTLGTGAGGDTGVQDGAKRTGFNQYEFRFSDVLAAAGLGVPGPTDIFGAPVDSRLAYDFDSGLAVNDVFGRFLNSPGLGVAGGDSMATEGDSGAPHFENGKIVGITSFGLSGALFDHNCGQPGNVDPSPAGPPVNGVPNCTNSSFGEIGVDTRASAFYDYITSHVPEPAAWGLMILGFGTVGMRQRRDRFLAAPTGG